MTYDQPPLAYTISSVVNKVMWYNASPFRGETWQGTLVSCLSLRGQTLEVHWLHAPTHHCTGLLSTPLQHESYLDTCIMSAGRGANTCNSTCTSKIHQYQHKIIIKIQALFIEIILPYTIVTTIQQQRWMHMDTQLAHPSHSWSPSSTVIPISTCTNHSYVIIAWPRPPGPTTVCVLWPFCQCLALKISELPSSTFLLPLDLHFQLWTLY